MADHHNGGLTHEDQEWIAQHLALTRVDQAPLPRPARRVNRLDALMPYAPAFSFSLMGAALIWVISVAGDFPRVWPGTILMFVLNFLSFGHMTWQREKRKAASRAGGAGRG